ncbi:hypothetical protein [Paraburkholderia sabiae]|uniref:hypothetical protein n=1 Tax=Paraburkholderia sabiae TaxID=273251 RepID=UPI001CC631F0|nr:hypothetical protein [Paraburkholderia sabiae]
MRSVDVCGLMRIDPVADPETAELAILTITRLALVMFFVPAMGPRIGTVYLSPSSIATSLRRACYVARTALRFTSRETGLLFAGLTQEALEDIIRQKKKRIEVNRIVSYTERGYWSDVPRCLVGSNGNGRYSYFEPESSPPDGAESETADETSTRSDNDVDHTCPLSDRFVSEVGWRACWFVDVLGPALIDCLSRLLPFVAIESSCDWDQRDWNNAKARRNDRVRKFLASYEWIDDDNHKIVPPFQVELPNNGRFSGIAKTPWPPRNFTQVLGLASLAQSLHLFVVLLATAGRISEVLSLSPAHPPKVSSSGMSIEGRTYKLAFSDQGAKMEWPLPEFAVRAVERQGELRHVLELVIGEAACAPAADERESEESVSPELWASVTSGAPIDTWYNKLLVRGLAPLGLEELLEGTRLHAHRFRTTIARLIALAVVGSPKILMDFFGHRTIEMTLRYILKDPLIRLEIEEVARAQVIMLARDAIQHADECGGPAAGDVQRAVRTLKVRLGRELGTDDVKELAEVLTMSGTYWQLVRRGVVCTKLPDQAGACSLRRGNPEPAACRSECSHRLEMAALREDVDMAIAQALEELEREVASSNGIMAEMWRGQILANLKRFPDIEEKWTKSEAFIQLMVGEATKV